MWHDFPSPPLENLTVPTNSKLTSKFQSVFPLKYVKNSVQVEFYFPLLIRFYFLLSSKYGLVTSIALGKLPQLTNNLCEIPG